MAGRAPAAVAARPRKGRRRRFRAEAPLAGRMPGRGPSSGEAGRAATGETAWREGASGALATRPGAGRAVGRLDTGIAGALVRLGAPRPGAPVGRGALCRA